MTRIASSRAALMGSSVLAPAAGQSRGALRAARPGMLLGAMALLAVSAPAFAQSAPPLPTGGVFVAGSGTIQSGPASMTITQASSRGVIDWRDFSIALEHQVSIQNGSGATLNRVTGGVLSRIDGTLSATGSVYLMNPHGVVVGPGGKVLTGGSFVASTRAIDPDAFMAGGPLAISGSSDGAIANAGSIVSKTGSVVMIARAVSNSGSIEASQGRVTLAAADDVLLATTDGKADGLYVSVGGGKGDITQTGRIEAAAVALRAANGNIFALAGNRDGLVQATGTATINGELWLTAPKGTVEVAGALKATNADGSGGRVMVNGRDVALAATANVSAAGTRGGEVVIGAASYGTASGLADSLVIADGARITAGGPDGGGRIETSGKAVDIGAANITAGSGGSWLIDPVDLLIDAPAAQTITDALDLGNNVLSDSTVAGSGAGDITVAAPIVWTGSGNLTFNAYRDLLVNAEIDGAGQLEMTVGRDLSVNAAISATQVGAFVTGTMTIGASGSVTSPGLIRFETANFVNQAGAGAVTSTGATWLIVSDDAAGSSDGGLTPDYYHYDYNNPPASLPSGNGRFYRAAPSVSFTLGPVVKTYDGTTDAVLDSSNVNTTGLINGDDFTLDGVYATKDAGTGIDVTADNFQANRGGIAVYGYTVTTPTVTDDVGVIDKALLTAAIIGNPTKTYNATTAVSLTPANFELTGVVAGETVNVLGAATAAYDSANAGSRTVNATFTTPNFSAGSGTLLTNYVLPTSATGAGLINPASILISGVTANDKVYDGTTAAILSTAGATIFGVVAGDSVTLDSSGASGVFATRNVGTAIAVTGTGFALTGASASNYLVAQPTGLAANITPASLVVSGLTANDKVYDGTRVATLNTAGLVITGLITGDDVSAQGSGAQINFATKNVGLDIPVTVSGVSLGGADAGNYNLSFSASLAADITPRPLSISANGTPTKIYDGTTDAFVDQSQVVIDNIVSGESISLTQAAGLEYADKNVGTWNITVSLTPSDFQAGANTLLSNYILPSSGSILGEITPAPLSITIVGNPTKTYDGNANASLGPSNFEVEGFVTGESATITQTSGSYASANAGVWTVTTTLDASDFDPIAGTLMSNYMIPSPVTGVGTIIRRDLGPGVVTVDITGNPTKVYDGNTIATLTPGDYSLGGFIAGEGAIITETVGEYAGKDAGQHAVTVQLDPGDFDPFPGTNLDNYTLPTEATGIGTILKAMLSAVIVGNPTHVYDATTRIALNPGSFSITGLIAGESMSVSPGNIGAFDSPNAGSRTITATFPSINSFVAGANTLLTNYVLPTSATGPGTITPAPLNILNVGAQNRVYDQTTIATLTGAAALFGVVSGDDVTLSSVGSTGTFATPNVGNGIAVTVAGFSISGADIANYTLFQPTGITANITPRGLTIANLLALDKFYDGTTAATLGGSPTLVGVLGGDTVLLNGTGSTASFLQSNVGTDLRVNIGGFGLLGPDSGNYSLTQPSGLTADINPLALTGAIIGNPTKTYDGTTSVSLTAANYTLAGFVAGEGGSIAQSSSASYDSANAGSRIVTATLVVSDFLANSGTLLSNYALPTSITGAGTINQAQLIAAIIGNPTKVYDATTAATLTSANYQLQGFVAGEGATVTETVGAYDSKNVGTRTVNATLGSGDFTANGGTTLSNYVLPTSASGTGTITQATVQVIGVLANDKVYDGTTVATFNNAGGGLSGVFAGDTVNLVTGGESGTFATKNVGTDIPVTATGYTTSGADAANYLVLQPVGLAADIFQAAIELASVTRVYDATTIVPTNNSAYTLSGTVSGDDVFVNASGITGNYADKNVGSNKLVTLTGVVLGGGDAGNYLIASGVTNEPIGFITPATLNVINALALNKTYDQNTIAQLDNTNTALSGVLLSDDVDLAFATTGNFDNANAGTNKPVTTTDYAISGTDAGNYTLVQPQGLTADILQRQLFLLSVTKVYDGTTALPTAASSYVFASVLSGDTVTAVTTGVSGQYNDNKNVGTAKPVTVNNLALAGPSGANYFIAPSITDTIGTITQATLTAAIIGNPTKTYDGTDAATLTSGNYQLTGFVLSEGATVTKTTGTYDSVNQGARIVTTSLASGDFTPGGGTLLSNYVLPTSASGAGTIDPRLLTISGVFANDKVYDGNTVAILDSTGAALVNVVSGDTVALNSAGATGVFAQKDVGTNIPVTASGYTLNNNPFGNYTLQQPTGLFADITAAQLTLTQVTRVYNANTSLPTDPAAYTLAGIVSGDTVTVNATAANASGSYADKNVNTGILVTIGNLLLAGADAGNYSIVSSITDQPIGVITPATLAAIIIGTPTKTYDGNIAALLAAGNYQITGFVGGEGATINQTAGAYDSANAGSRTVTATLAAGNFNPNAGTSLSNYILPTSASGAGLINQKALAVAIIGNPTKIYDGTDVATLTSANYDLTGFIAGEGASVTQTVGAYDSANAGPRTVTAILGGSDFAENSGTLLANYVLPTSAIGAGQIDRATLAAAIIGNPTRTYDATTAITLAPANYQLTGFVTGEGATVTETNGVFVSPNAGIRLINAALDAGDFTANSGTLLTNYNLPTLASGNGTIDQALLAAVIIGNPTKTYDGSDAATLASGNYELTGFIGTQSATITQTLGSYDSPNAGSRTVTALLGAGDFAPGAGTVLSNYVLPTLASGNGTIDQALLAATITGNPTKTYDGTNVATLTSSDYTLTGFVSGEGAVVTETAGTYDSANAGPRTVTTSLGAGDFTAISGTLLSNYVLPTSAAGAGLINRATLSAAIIGIPTKTYDATTLATLAAANFALSGFVAGEGATVTRTSGNYAVADAGFRVVSTTLASGDFAANSGTLLTNYNLPISASGIGLIERAALTAAIVGNPTKTYDGTDAATLTSTNYQLTGFVAGQGASVLETAGTYGSPNVGLRSVTAALGSADFVANSGTSLLNYVLPTSASGFGTINQALLAATITGNPTKVYDGTNAATLTSGDYAITGFVAGESATITETVGTYDAANAGSRTVLAVLGAGDFTAGSGTLLTNYVLPTSAAGAGTIDQALLTAAIIGTPTKTYDGTTVATLGSANYALTGFVTGEGATVTQTVGAYASANAGPRTVTAMLAAGDFTANSGTLLANYVLPTDASGAGLINQAALTAIIIGTPTKTYDGTTAATLTSANYQLGGFVTGEGATVTETVGAYGSADAGPRIVTASLAAGDFTADSGTLLANYVLPTSASGAGLINQATLNAIIIGNPTKTYDGTTAATLASANYQLTGFVTGEGATVTETSGTYASANAGSRLVTATLAGSDFAANSGTTLSNYVLPTSATGLGTIDQALLTAAIIGTPTKTYDGTAAATLTSANFALSGFIAGEGATVTQTAGTYASANAGPRLVTASLAAGDFTANGSTLLSNYVLPTSASGAGLIDQALLTAAIIGNPTKVYDGTTAATLTSANYQLTGFVAGESATVTETVGAYGSPNAGIRTVTAALGSNDFTAGSGTTLSNYVLPTSASGLGTIDQATLTAAIIGNPTKTYDGTTLATLTGANYELTGFVGGQGATVTQTAGTYGSADAGPRVVTASLAAGDFTADSGTLLSNYVLPNSATGLGTINRAALTAIIIGNPGKTYDGTTAATLTSANYQLGGFVSGQGATVTETVGTYASADAGIRLVTALLDSGDFTANSGTTLSNYTLPTSASGLGTISQATLNAIIIGNPTKTYDGTTAATLTSANYQLTGFIAGESATVTETVGTYGSANAGVRLVTATLTGSDFAANGGTTLANYVLPTSASGLGTIDQALLTAIIVGNPTKTYDGNADATLTSANYQMSGFVAGEGATVTQTAGIYDSANAGPRLVSATLAAGDFTATGSTLLSNYVLPTGASGAGTIDQALLTAAIIGNPTKTYDGTTTATLTSANYALTGFVAGESATVTETVGIYSSPNAGIRTVTAALGSNDFTAGSGTLLANYVLPTSASGLGTIDQATLTAAIIGNPTKIYDGMTVATLAPANYDLTGFIAGEGATVTQTVGTYASADAGLRIVTASLASGDFTANSGTLLSNYVLPVSASGLGTISQATLTAIIVGNPTKTYDGTTAASLTSANYQLGGFVTGEGATVTETVGSYASPDAGSRLVTALLGAGDFTANSGTTLSNYVLPTSASGLGTISQATLNAIIIGNPTKTYDGTTAATLTSANYQLSGFVTGEGASVTETSGTYDSANAGSRTVTALLASNDFAANSGTTLSNYVLPTSASGLGTIDQALLTAAIIGTPTKTYDGTTVAALTSANFALNGFVTGESATVTQTVGTYDSANAGPRTVNAALAAGDFTANGSTLLSNYVLPTSASGAGLINQALLTAAIIGNPTRTYDGTTAATLTPANYSLTGFVAGESATVTEAVGIYSSPNAGSRTVTAALGSNDFVAGSGTLLSNYVLPVSASGLGTIDQALLTAAIIGNPTKVYDGTTAATLAPANYELTGFVGGEGAIVTETVGTYAAPNVGLRIVTASLASADFTANSGTLLSNYVLPTSASGLGTINQATLTAIIIGNPTKTYDGTTAATLTSANYQLGGFVTGEGATVTETVGTYASVDAGSRLVTAILGAGDFTANSGTTLSNYTLPTSASGLGTISQATLNAIIIGNPTKTYDGTTAATLTSANYQLTGFITGEGATVTETSGTYASANAGVRLVTATLTGSDFAANGGTTLANYVLPTSASGLGTIDQALLTAIIVGNPTKTYDGNADATLTSANYQMSGFVAGEGATVTQTAGTYDSANAGPRLVNATLAAGDFTATGSTLLSNYVLPTGASGAGMIDQALLTAAIIGNPTKTYDGTTAAALTSANYQLTGFVAGESATVTENVGTYDSPNAGSRTVTAALGSNDFTAGSGTLLSNYVLPTSATGLGTIDQATLTAAIIGNPTKVYDGTTVATLTSANYQLTGFVTGEGATVTETSGTYAAPDAGPRIVTATLAAGDFTADSGTLLSNYVLPTSASGLGSISQATLTAAIVGNPTKVYDGTTAATLTSANYALTGFVSGEGATVTETVGTYASPDAGSRLVTAILGAGDLTADSGTTLSNYVLPTSASGLGTISQATLNAIIIGNPTKTYDGTTAATLTSANYQLTGFITGEGATVTETAGTYDSANAGSRTITATLAGTDFAANSGTTLSNYVLPTSASGLGTIDQALLAAAIIGTPTKTYDGTDLATLTSANFALTGFVTGEGATVTQTAGTYDSANAGPRLVTVSLAAGDFTATGSTLLANYVLPTSASGAGLIEQALLTAAIIGNPTKTYDGTSTATLGSANYQLTGFVTGEGATVTETTGTYDSANAGSRTVTAVLASNDFAANSGTLLSNYVLPTGASGAGTIDQALLAAAIIGNPTKAYDGSTVATLTSANYALTGFVTGEGATVTQTVGAYDSPNAGARTVTASLAGGDFTANSGTLLSNYILPVSASGAGTIGQAAITAIIIGTPTKTYDGTLLATLTSANYQLSGFVAGEGATVTQTSGTYDSPNAGPRTVTASIAAGDFAANSGTILGNYILPTSASGAGLINQALLSAIIIGNPTKTYDGSTTATLTSANYQLSGFIGSESATVTQTLGTYDSANAGARTVTAALGAGDFAAGSGTLLSNYVLPTNASGIGTIDRALLAASIINDPTKVYDGTTAATLTQINFELTGFIAGEGATVTEAVGAYDTPNAGLRTVTAALDAGDFTANSGTLLSNYVLPVSASGAGHINQALLTAAIIGTPTKVYDGNALATLASGNYQLTGFVAGEGATVTQTAGLYDSANAGPRTVTATLGASDFTATGATLLSNYVLPTSASGAGLINQALLTAAIIGSPTKTYDGTALATLTSANYALTGFVAGEGATVTQTVGTYDSPNAGPRTVTAMLAAGDFTANSGTLLSNYVLPTDASGAGLINQALLSAAIIGAPTKIYDGTDLATLTSANFALTGFVAGEDATVTQTVGTYDSPNAGPRLVTAALGAGDFAATGSTLLSNYVLPVSASGAGQIDQATLTAMIIGNPTRVYDGTTVATLTSANYQLAGFVADEGATVTQTVGAYDSANAGSRTVTAALAAGDFAANSGTLLANYVLPTSATGAGTIDQALLTAAIIGNPTKVYDGTAAATLTSANYQLTGFVTGESATVTQIAGTYDSANAGARTVTAILASGNFMAGSGTLLSNYVLPTSATGAGTIDQALLSAAIIGNPTKIYDATTLATLTSANYQLTGFVAGEGATITETVGAYDSANAGARTVTAMLAAGDFAANSGTLLANYVLPTSASGMGTIDQALLAAAIIGTPTRSYDGTVVATLTSANYALTGFVGSEGATVTQTAGAYDSPNAGPRTVTANLAAGDFAADSGTLLSNYVLPTSASGAGLINQAMLAAAIIGNPTRIYDGTTLATLTSANYALSGFVAGEGATVTQAVGTYDSANAGARTVTAMLAAGDFAANSGTLLSNYVLPTSASGMGTIDRAALAAAIVGNPSKVYDGNTAASLTSANYQLTGFVTGEGATVSQTVGTYDSPNAGSRTVTANLAASNFIANTGTLLSNYILPTSASGLGTIGQAALTAIIIGNPTKTYDGTTLATLTSANYQLSGFLGGDGAIVTETTGVYDSANAGPRMVTAMLDGSDFAANSGTLLSNYALPTSASGAGTIDPRQIELVYLGVANKVYDGTLDATLTTANFRVIGFVNGEGINVDQSTVHGTYGNPNVGLHTVTVAPQTTGLVPLLGTEMSNYVVRTGINGVGQITPAPLTAAIIGTPTKTYNGTTLAALTSANFALSGFVAGEGAAVTETTGTYSSANAGDRTVTATLDAGDFTANSGTLLSNYALPTSASGAGLINRADLAVAIIGDPTKPYDGNSEATLTSSNYAITGFVTGEGAIITETHGTYDGPEAGDHEVSATLDSGDYTANTGTLLSNYNLPTVAEGPGEITPSDGPHPCSVPWSVACNINNLSLLLGTRRFYIPYPSTYSVYFARTNGFAALPGVLRQSSVTPIPGGLLIRTGMPIINASEQVLQQGASGKEFYIMFPPETPVDLPGTQP